MKIDLDRLENIERSVIYIKPHEKTVTISGKDYILISAKVWEDVQKALGESESDKTPTAEDKGVEFYARATPKQDIDEGDHESNSVQFHKRTDAEGSSHVNYEIGTFIVSNTSSGPRVGIVIGNATVGFSTVAYFEKQKGKELLKPALTTSIKNIWLSKPAMHQILNPAGLTDAMLAKYTSYTGLPVKAEKADWDTWPLGYVVGTVRHYAGVPSAVYVATLNDAGKTGKIIIAHTANLFRMDGTPLKLPKV